MSNQHCDIVGATRSGKTNFLLSTFEDIEGGFCFLDKHGDAARRLADGVECVYWRPADLSFSVGFNPLQNVHSDQRWKVTADIVSVFSDIWKLGPETPRLLYYLRASLRILLDTPGTTLLDIRRVLSNDKFRNHLLRNISDSETRQTWKEYSLKDSRQQAQEIGSLQNKVAALADPLPLRHVLGQPTSTIDFRKLLANGQRLVVDLSDIGDEPAALLGALIINGYKQAADEIRNLRPYRLVIDECQNFGTGILDTILAESGKRELWLTLAHQFVSQLDERLWHSILSNCGTLVSFRVGAEDAPVVAKALNWHAQDLQAQRRGVARYVTLLNGKPTDAIRMETELADLPTGFLDANVRRTRARYARPRAKVEDLLSGKRNAPRRRGLL